MVLLDTWRRSVRRIQSFLDEDYPVDAYGILSYNNWRDHQLPWGRMIVGSFTDRILLNITGGAATKASAEQINQWIQQAVEFGNSSLIVSDSGNIRIPLPTNSFAQKTQDGNIMFYEEIGDGLIWGWNDRLFFRKDRELSTEDIEIADAQIFTIFHGDSNMKPFGESRISPANRSQITWASFLMCYMEAVASGQSHKQLVISGVSQDMIQAYQHNNKEALERLQAIETGVGKAMLLAESTAAGSANPSVSTIDPTDPSGLVRLYSMAASGVASSCGMEPREFGIEGSVQPSAEAQYAAKDKLVLQIINFEKKIQSTVNAALLAIADVNGEAVPRLYWGNPATPSAQSLLDALSKLVAIQPIARMSPITLMRHGVTAEEIEEWERLGLSLESLTANKLATLETNEVIFDE